MKRRKYDYGEKKQDKRKLNISMPEPLFGKLVKPQLLSQYVLKLLTYNTQGYQEMYYFEI